MLSNSAALCSGALQNILHRQDSIFLVSQNTLVKLMSEVYCLRKLFEEVGLGTGHCTD